MEKTIKVVEVVSWNDTVFYYNRRKDDFIEADKIDLHADYQDYNGATLEEATPTFWDQFAGEKSFTETEIEIYI